MMLLEHDAKELLGQRGVPIPEGFLAEDASARPPFEPPWIVKAQVPVGGRGKAGGIIAVDTPAELHDALERLIGRTLKGHKIAGCRVEQRVARADEAYLSMMVDPASGGIRVMASAEGGVDIESAAGRAGLLSAIADPTPESVLAAYELLAAKIPATVAVPLRKAVAALAPIFFELEALLLEINPLFIGRDGSWQAGDAKLVIDENAIPRRPALAALMEERAAAYPEVTLKLAQGFDLVELDPEGQIGLITTGAGLSMQLVDELVQRGCPPLNFCDIRTGMFRGDPARLILVMRWMAAHRSVKAVLINFFAGSTHLGELSGLLLKALAAVPELSVPITARLIGNGLDEARTVIAEAGNPIAIETDLDRAVDLAIASMGKSPR